MANVSVAKSDSESSKKAGLRGSKKKFRKVEKGIAHIQASFNNTIITITDLQGNVLAKASAGSEGFKGSRKSTPHAAHMAAQKVATKVIEDYKMEQIIVQVKGPGPGRDAFKGFPQDKKDKDSKSSSLQVILIDDVTGIPHNGPRPCKKRRV